MTANETSHPGDDLIVGQVDRYLCSDSGVERSWVFDGEDLSMRVLAPVNQWRMLTNELGLQGDTAAGARLALERIDANGKTVDRRLLSSMSLTVQESSADRVACWFATMVWGAGPRRRHRLRQWTGAMRPTLAEDLARSLAAAADSRMADAYLAARLPGVGEAYLTKWLWALGLPSARVMSPRPMVLDSRVWQVLNQCGWRPTGRNQAERWVDYCASLRRWAVILCDLHPGWLVDAERLEQLLFDRGDRSLFTTL